ncbi:MAG: hypothetical protein QME68_02805 [Elusimicrobiota bacterium]|nr:hypothetical protein [Elusimicrobiota bacterium]
MSFFRSLDLSKDESIIFSIGLGFGFYSIAVLLLGLLRLLYPSVIFIIVVVFAFVSRLEIKKTVYMLKEKFLKMSNYRITINDFALLLPTIIFALITFVICFAPITYYDSLTYHMALPEIYLRKHCIEKIDFNIWSNFPANMEMLFVIALASGNDIAANLITFVFSITTLFSIILLGEKYFDTLTAKLSAFLFLTTPSIILLSSSTYC